MRRRRPSRPWLRFLIAIPITVLLILLFLFFALLGIIFVPTHWPATNGTVSANPAVKYYYVALGDSLAFGFQPNFNWDQGYTEQWWPELQRHGSRSFMDFGCNGETTTEFIHGGCPYQKVRHNYFSGSQLEQALDFIKAHPGQVGPVTIDEGADDVLPYINLSACKVNRQGFKAALVRLDKNLRTIILPQLLHALRASHDMPPAQLIMMNYYDPFENKCHLAHPYILELNRHLAGTAAAVHVPIVDVYAAFDSNQHPNPKICTYTWACGFLQGIHPTTTGYAVITHAFERLTGY